MSILQPTIARKLSSSESTAALLSDQQFSGGYSSYAPAQYDIGLVMVLFNNNKFQNVQRQQKEWFGGRIIGSDLENPDFVAYAESFGIRSSRVDSPKALRSELDRYLAHDEPGLIEVPVGDMASPWQFIIREPLFSRGRPAN